jgi:hypothetical protein
LGSATLAAGIALIAKTPDSLGDSSVPAPSRHAGALLASAAFPLLTYAITYVVRHGLHASERGPRQLAKLAKTGSDRP